MICQICKSKVVKVYKVVKGEEILECEVCQLGMLGPTVKGTNFNRSNQVGTNFYDHSTYKEQEVKLRKTFERLVGKVTKYKQSGRVLDIGAGFGLFSSILMQKGDYELEIIEPLSTPHYLNNLKFKLHKVSFERYLEQ